MLLRSKFDVLLVLEHLNLPPVRSITRHVIDAAARRPPTANVFQRDH